MDSRTGKKIRLGRILDPASGRGIVVAASHGVLTGAPAGLRTVSDMKEAFGSLVGANGIMVAPGSVGLVEDVFVGRNRPSLVVHLDWKSHGRRLMTPGENGISEGTLASLATIDEVAAAGADAVMSYLYVGHRDNDLERREIERNARLAADCARLGIVLIIEPRAVLDYVDETQVANPELLGWYCRMSAEIGADIVKCIWPGDRDSYAEIIGNTTVPVLLAGGPAGDESIEETMQIAHDTVVAGGAGLMFGRRIYSSKNPSAVLAGLRAIVHDGAAAADGVAIFSETAAAGD
ncbi:MAG: hypothetical protein B5766_13085 [Candidatus Lumbricidophila eiseniae]|uniref:Fructose-bisphosphate aldolase n=1 Tax=Candidatus Lumbricidiphila eiseniae TaxID=1969409 RepID=A0A2A6FN96_9MICO|nr:MAG: hypothetical protein B5766_13085 [Candidatus Lumbricidophila eiseniae]